MEKGRAKLGAGRIFYALAPLLALAVYFQARRFSFLNFDDPSYVYQNPYVAGGLTWEGVRRAFGMEGVAYWHPLPMLSHMLDVTLFGLDPGLHHLSSALFHAVNAFLLYALLLKLSGSAWKSGFIAAVFAVHPVNADSVAWVSERKSLLCALFFLLALIFYARHAQRPGWRRLLPSLAAAAGSLMAKPIAVVLPALLLLLDFWPLGRLRGYGVPPENPALRGKIPALSLTRLAAEKVPFLILSGASVAATLFSARIFGDVALGERPLPLRLENALVSYAEGYPGLLFWPARLAVFYPYPARVAPWLAAVSALILAAAVVLALLNARKRPWMAVGLFWYLLILAPMSGIKQAGLWPALADRFAYLPQIGLFLVATWAAAGAFYRVPRGRAVSRVLAALLVAALFVMGWRQAGFYRDSETLFSRAVSVTDQNYVAENDLGTAILEKGGPWLALPHFLAALSYNPAYADAENNAGAAFLALDRPADAAPYLARLLARDPKNASALVNLAACRMREGKTAEAQALAGRAFALEPGFAEGYARLAEEWMRLNKPADAVRLYERAIAANPLYFPAYSGLGRIYFSDGRLDKALEIMGRATRAVPQSPEAWLMLGNALAKLERWTDAAAAYRRAVNLAPRLVPARLNLAAAAFYLNLGDEAAENLAAARRLDPQNPRLLEMEEALGIKR